MYLVNYVFSDSVCIHCVFITHSCSFHRVFMLYTCCILIDMHIADHAAVLSHN